MTDLSQYRDAFIAETRESLVRARDELMALRANTADKDSLFELVRFFHSLKSSAAMMGHQGISDACKDQEHIFREVQDGHLQLLQEMLYDAEKKMADIEKELKL